MANPSKNKYGVYMYVARVPADLVHVIGKRVYSISLGTKDPKEARKLFNEMVAQKEREHTALRTPQESVSYQRIVALAGEAYRSLSSEIRESGGPRELRLNRVVLSDLSTHSGWLRKIADGLWQSHEIVPDAASRANLLAELETAFGQLIPVVSRMSEGDFRPDENLKRFPQVSRKAEPKAASGSTSITDLYDLWKRDHLANKKAVRTADEYKAKVAYFIKWLKHDDATRVTKRDLATFADHVRHDLGLSAKTVNGKYLTCLRAIFTKGFSLDLIENNVAAAVKYAVPKRTVTRPSGFTDAEAKAILAIANRSLLAADDGKGKKRSLHNRLTGRWVPWLQCYTGARVAEMTQLRKEDVLVEHGVHCLRITPEAGSVKTGVYRLVPIHPHLIEMGFLDFVASCPEGPLFYATKGKRKGTNTPAQWAGNALARWIKLELGEAWPGIQPNHAWRHRFATIGREVDVPPHYQKVLQGWSTGEAAAGYGETTIKALYREIQKIPKIVVE